MALGAPYAAAAGSRSGSYEPKCICTVLTGDYVVREVVLSWGYCGTGLGVLCTSDGRVRRAAAVGR
eukprot:3293094-Rhodomonas_salina.1